MKDVQNVWLQFWHSKYTCYSTVKLFVKMCWLLVKILHCLAKPCFSPQAVSLFYFLMSKLSVYHWSKLSACYKFPNNVPFDMLHAVLCNNVFKSTSSPNWFDMSISTSTYSLVPLMHDSTIGGRQSMEETC